jgi:hypothetical protein
VKWKEAFEEEGTRICVLDQSCFARVVLL